jgi:DNA adenine methylase
MFADLSPSAEYREPFLGSGAVALTFLKQEPGRPAWLNDRDPTMAILWYCVIHRQYCLERSIARFPQAMDAATFLSFKDRLCAIVDVEDLRQYDPARIGFEKLAVHQMSYSGLGTCAGGPMTDIGCRYNPELLCDKIGRAYLTLTSVLLRNKTCTCLDFSELFRPGEAAYYLDPPYYEAGPGLYQHSFVHEDHERLAGLLRMETRPWLLSYDRHEVILKLYSGWSRIEEIEVPYSINGCAKKVELLISGL